MPIQVTVEDTAPCAKKLKIEVPAEEVAAEFEKIVKEFQKEATLPGFRRGSAPANLVERKFTREIEDELKGKLVPQSYRQAVTDHHLHVVSEPRVEELSFKKGEPLRFTVTVETAPAFELPQYKGIKVEMSAVEVTDADVDEVLHTLQDQHAQFVDVAERAAQMQDFLVVNYSAVADGKPLAEIAPAAKTLGEGKDFWLWMEEDSFLPKFCGQLVGAAKAERRQVFVDFPADFPVKEVAGRKATFFVEVTAVKEKKLPPLDDAFAASLGPQHDTMEKLRAFLRERVREQRDKEEAKNRLVDALLGQLNFDLPPSLVAQETRNVIYDIVGQNQSRGITREQIEEKKDEIFGHASKNATERVKAMFVLGRIAEQEKIEVTEQELNTRLDQMALRYRVPTAQLKKQLVERGGLGEVEHELLIGKTLDFLFQNATVETKSEPQSATK
jgi:trigger factor